MQVHKTVYIVAVFIVYMDKTSFLKPCFFWSARNNAGIFDLSVRTRHVRNLEQPELFRMQIRMPLN